MYNAFKTNFLTNLVNKIFVFNYLKYNEHFHVNFSKTHLTFFIIHFKFNHIPILMHKYSVHKK